MLASLAGILIASVWNYSVGAILVWRINRPPANIAGQPVLRP
jgi:hypothetical protein